MSDGYSNCQRCGSVLGIDCGEAEHDFNAKYCSEVCWLEAASTGDQLGLKLHWLLAEARAERDDALAGLDSARKQAASARRQRDSARAERDSTLTDLMKAQRRLRTARLDLFKPCTARLERFEAWAELDTARAKLSRQEELNKVTK